MSRTPKGRNQLLHKTDIKEKLGDKLTTITEQEKILFVISSLSIIPQ